MGILYIEFYKIYGIRFTDASFDCANAQNKNPDYVFENTDYSMK